MKRAGSAVWEGGLRDGRGVLSTRSGVLSNSAYSFADRFEGGPHTNPEELIAAAHAACFSMALSGVLGGAGLAPQSIRTTATADFEKLDAGWTVTAIHLQVSAKVPGASAAAFEKAAQEAKAGCPVSRLLHTKITMEARLEA